MNIVCFGVKQVLDLDGDIAFARGNCILVLIHAKRSGSCIEAACRMSIWIIDMALSKKRVHSSICQNSMFQKTHEQQNFPGTLSTFAINSAHIPLNNPQAAAKALDFEETDFEMGPDYTSPLDISSWWERWSQELMWISFDKSGGKSGSLSFCIVRLELGSQGWHWDQSPNRTSRGISTPQVPTTPPLCCIQQKETILDI